MRPHNTKNRAKKAIWILPREIAGTCGKWQIILSKYDFASTIKYNFLQFNAKT